ncbi:putative RNA polymerase, Rpb5, RNA polymerase Rpb5 domain superfamily [Helianthus anomalus]
MSTSLSEEEIKRLFRIRKTVMEMLKDRNYLVGDFELEMDRRQFVSKYGEHMKREDLVISKSMKNDSSEQGVFITLLYIIVVNSDQMPGRKKIYI